MVIRFHCGLICTGGFVLFEDERRRKETNNKNDEKGMYQKKKKWRSNTLVILGSREACNEVEEYGCFV